MAIEWIQRGSLKGPKGDAGEAGEKGATGLGWRGANIAVTGGATVQLTNVSPSAGVQVGDKLVDVNGDVWEVASVGDGSVTVGADKALSVKGPQGPQGEKGEDGTGVNIKGAVDSSASLPGEGEPGDAYVTSDTGNLWVWDEEQSKYVDTGAQIKGPKGDKGDAGQAATVTVGTTTTAGAGEQASVTNSGTESAAVLNFTVPKGEKGDTGAAGPGVSVGSGAPSAPGQVGECYIDVETGNLYRYEDVSQ